VSEALTLAYELLTPELWKRQSANLEAPKEVPRSMILGVRRGFLFPFSHSAPVSRGEIRADCQLPYLFHSANFFHRAFKLRPSLQQPQIPNLLLIYEILRN
jgi:hypothetical protein